MARDTPTGLDPRRELSSGAAARWARGLGGESLAERLELLAEQLQGEGGWPQQTVAVVAEAGRRLGKARGGP